jgi:hypothetical protein
VPPGFDALADTDSFGVKTFRKLIKLLRPYLLTFFFNSQIYIQAVPKKEDESITPLFIGKF